MIKKITYRYVIEDNKERFVKGFGSLIVALHEMAKINQKFEYLVRCTRTNNHYLNEVK